MLTLQSQNINMFFENIEEELKRFEIAYLE